MTACVLELVALLLLVSGVDGVPSKRHFSRLQLLGELRSRYLGLLSKAAGNARDNEANNPDKVAAIINSPGSDVSIGHLTATQLEDAIYQFAFVALNESVPEKCRRPVIDELFIGFLLNRLQDSMDSDLSGSFYNIVRVWAREEGYGLDVYTDDLIRELLKKYRPLVADVKKMLKLWGLLEGSLDYFISIAIYAEDADPSNSLADLLNKMWSFTDKLKLHEENCENHEKIKAGIHQFKAKLVGLNGKLNNFEDYKEFQSAYHLTDKQTDQLRGLESIWFKFGYAEWFCRMWRLEKNWSIQKFVESFAQDFVEDYFGHIVQGVHITTCFDDHIRLLGSDTNEN